MQKKHKDYDGDSLQAELNMLRNILLNMPGNVAWKNTNGVFLGCNKTVAKVCKLKSPEEIVGKRNNDLFDTKIAVQVDQTDQTVINSGQAMQVEQVGINTNQEVTLYFDQKVPIFNQDNEVVGLLCTGIDIGKFKQLEEELRLARYKAEASNRAKSQFLSVVNHELRTPLVSLIGLIKFLKKEAISTDERDDVIVNLENCAQHLLGMINNVLDFSRLEFNKEKIHEHVLNVNQLIKSILDIFKLQTKEKGIALNNYVDPDIPEVLTDSRILKHILINLLSNAIKFTEKGKIDVSVTLLARQKNYVKLRFAVSDTGKGIPKDALTLIFEPFQQLEEVYVRENPTSGSGLGLAIVKKLAEMLGTEIIAASEVNRGSTFEFTIDLRIFHNENAPCISPVKISQTPIKHLHHDGRPLYILIIEDDPIIQFIHKKFFTEYGCIVEIAETGRSGIEMCQNHDMIFVDINLPDISGFDVIKAIRSAHHAYLPIVALTAYTGEPETKAALAAGANEVVSKPITMDHISNLFKRYIKHGLNLASA